MGPHPKKSHVFKTGKPKNGISHKQRKAAKRQQAAVEEAKKERSEDAHDHSYTPPTSDAGDVVISDSTNVSIHITTSNNEDIGMSDLRSRFSDTSSGEEEDIEVDRLQGAHSGADIEAGDVTDSDFSDDGDDRHTLDSDEEGEREQNDADGEAADVTDAESNDDGNHSLTPDSSKGSERERDAADVEIVDVKTADSSDDDDHYRTPDSKVEGEHEQNDEGSDAVSHTDGSSSNNVSVPGQGVTRPSRTTDDETRLHLSRFF